VIPDEPIVEIPEDGVSPSGPSAGPGGDKKERKGKVPEKCDAPNEAEYNDNVKRLEKALTDNQAEVQSSMTLLKKLKDEREAARKKRIAVAEKLGGSKKIINDLFDEAQKFKIQVDTIEHAKTEKKKKLMALKSELKYEDPAELDKAIANIEYQLTTSSFPLNHEKKLIANIATLRNQKSIIKVYKDMEVAAASGNIDTKELKARAAEKNKEARRLKEESSAANKELSDLKIAEKKINDQITALLDRRTKMSAEWSASKSELETLKRSFKNQQYQFERYSEYVKYLKRVAQREEWNRRRAEEAEYYKAQEQEEAAKDPHEKENQLIDLLERYCSRIAPKETAEEKSQEELNAASAELASARNEKSKTVKKTVTVLPKKEKKSVMFGARPARVQPAAAAKEEKEDTAAPAAPADKVLTHIPDVFSQFHVLRITPPRMQSEVAGTLEKLRELKEKFKHVPAPVEKKKAAAPAAEEEIVEIPEIPEIPEVPEVSETPAEAETPAVAETPSEAEAVKEEAAEASA